MPRKNKRHRIKIDLSEWDLGDWSERIEKGVEINFWNEQIEITIPMKGSEIFKNIAREIAQEAIQTFVETDILEFYDDGLRYCGDSATNVPDRGLLLCKWENMRLHPAAGKRMQVWLDKEMSGWKETEDGWECI